MKTDNQLIAEFMEVSRCTDSGHSHDPCYYYESEGYITNERMKYHSSWDWLMPVVEKIECELLMQFTIHTGYVNISGEYNNKKINQDYCFEHQADTKIIVTYRAVVDLIKWYNSSIEK